MARFAFAVLIVAFTFSTNFAAEMATGFKIGEVTANDTMAAKVYTAYDAFRKQVSAWSAVTEKAFYDRIQS